MAQNAGIVHGTQDAATHPAHRLQRLQDWFNEQSGIQVDGQSDDAMMARASKHPMEAGAAAHASIRRSHGGIIRAIQLWNVLVIDLMIGDRTRLDALNLLRRHDAGAEANDACDLLRRKNRARITCRDGR